MCCSSELHLLQQCVAVRSVYCSVLYLLQHCSTQHDACYIAILPKKRPGPRYILMLDTLLCLICTINSKLKYCLIPTHLSEPGWISADFLGTGSTPAVFQAAFRAGTVTRTMHAIML